MGAMKNCTVRFWAAKQQFGVSYTLRCLDSFVFFFPSLFFFFCPDFNLSRESCKGLIKAVKRL